MRIVELSRDFRFEAAHCLPRVPEGHKCRTPHGHSYAVVVTVRGPVDPENGWLMDYADITKAVAPLVAELDHHNLNDIPGLANATAEHLAFWFWERLEGGLPGLLEVDVRETDRSRCRYRGEEAAP